MKKLALVGVLSMCPFLLFGSIVLGETNQPCGGYKAFLESHPQEDLLVSDELAYAAKSLYSACEGLDSVELKALSALPAGLSKSANDALAQLIVGKSGDVQYDYEAKSHSVTRLAFRHAQWSGDAVDFYSEFMASYRAFFNELWGLSETDDFEVVWDSSGKKHPGVGSPYRVILKRVNKGIPYDADRMEILFTERSPGLFALDTVFARFSGEHPQGDPPETMNEYEIRQLAEQLSNCQADDSFPTGKLKIRVSPSTGEAQWTQTQPVLCPEETSPLIVIVDVSNGTLAGFERPDAYKTGTVRLPTNVPWEEYNVLSGKQLRGIPTVDICDDSKTENGISICDTSTYLDTTDFDGDFRISDQSGNLWFVDFRGDWLYDISDEKEDECSMGLTSLLSNLTYPSSLDMSWTSSNCRGRRGEVYFHGNYAAEFANAVGYTSSMNSPAYFYVTSCESSSDCRDFSGCPGGDLGLNYEDRFWVRYTDNAFSLSGCDDGDEIQYRQTIYHEYAHNLRWALGGRGNDSSGWGYPYGAEEGWARYSAWMMSRHQFLRDAYRPNFSFPSDWLSETSYREGMVAMYGRFHNQVGYPAYSSIMHSRGEQTSSTILVGDNSNNCASDQNSDGVVYVDDCNPNSIYRHVLDQDAGVWAFDNEHATEISRAFHRHILDGNPDGTGSSFPWKDNVTNLSQNGPFIPLEFPDSSRQITLVYGPDYPALPSFGAGEDKLSFEYFTDSGTESDIDKFTIFARAGEHYQIETQNLVNTDTVIEIRNESWSSIVYECDTGGTSQCLDDDDGYGRASLLDFYPSTTGWYRLYAYPYSQAYTGPDTRYEVKMSIVDDDFGDSRTSANPIALEILPRDGTIDTAGDADWFFFYAPDGGNVFYTVCPDGTSGMIPYVELYDSDGNYLTGSYFYQTGCSTFKTYSLGSAGLYYLRVIRIAGATSGDYVVWIDRTSGSDLDQDTPATAFDVSALADAPYPGISTDFDNYGDDEDWFVFESAEGEQWLITTYDLDEDVDTVLEIYADDDSGMLDYTSSIFILDDDDGGVDHDLASSLVFTAPRSGDYYVKATESGGDDGGRYGIVFLSNGVCSLAPPAFPEQ